MQILWQSSGKEIRHLRNVIVKFGATSRSKGIHHGITKLKSRSRPNLHFSRFRLHVAGSRLHRAEDLGARFDQIRNLV